MKVDVEKMGADVILHLNGVLLAQNSDSVVAQLRCEVRPSVRRMVLDAQGLAQLDSSGVGALVTCLNVAKEAKIPLFIAGLNGRALQSIQIAKADRFMPLCPDVAAALAAP